MLDGTRSPPSAAPLTADLDSAILSSERDRRKRRQKFGTACYPCRQRKVKCTYEVPCAKCVERDHAELCIYENQPKRVNIERRPEDVVTANGEDFVPKSDWDRLCRKVDGLERVITELRDVLRDGLPSIRRELHSRPQRGACPSDVESEHDDINAPGILTGDDTTGEMVHIGASSVPAMVMAMTKGADDSIRHLADNGMLPLFALDNESATYPFVDLWGLPHGSSTRLQELAKLVPGDTECLELFRNFRDNVNVIFPVIPDISNFEVALVDFLAVKGQFDRDQRSPVGPDLYGKSMHWVGLLFATLASGCQCTSRDRKARQLTAQVYVCCAYESLRMVNYLARSSVTDIQTLLIFCNVLSNNMNAGVAWSLVGLTTRLAQGLGLNHDPPSNVPSEVRTLRENVWECILSQDALLSVAFDRPSTILSINRHTPNPRHTDGSYKSSMLRLAQICLEMVARRTPRLTAGAKACINQTYTNVQVVMRSARAHLLDIKECKSISDQLEHWNFQMQSSHLISELCRPLLSHPKRDDKDVSELLDACLESLRQAIRSFIHMQGVTGYAKYSWVATQRGLSAALLLCIIPETRSTAQTHDLVRELVQTLSSIYSDLGPSEIPTPISRALATLGKLVYPGGSTVRQDTGFEPQTQFDKNMDDFAAGWINEFSLSPDSLLSLSEYEDSPYTAMNYIMFGQQREPSL